MENLETGEEGAKQKFGETGNTRTGHGNKRAIGIFQLQFSIFNFSEDRRQGELTMDDSSAAKRREPRCTCSFPFQTAYK
jgi:hypothetical protein